MKKKFKVNIFDVLIILILALLVFLFVNRNNIKSSIGKEAKKTVIITTEAKDNVTKE